MHEESSQGRTNSRDRGVVGGAGGQVDRVVGGAGGGDGGVVQVGGEVNYDLYRGHPTSGNIDTILASSFN